MVYRAIGLMSGSSLDGLDMVMAEFQENAGRWTYEIKAGACKEYTPEWVEKLACAGGLTALDFELLHIAYGEYTGDLVRSFIEENRLQYQVQLIASHGHTVFHVPARHTTVQLGHGAAIAAATGINVVCDLRAMDLVLGGQGAPIVPMGEKLLFPDATYFLNIGGIANLSVHLPETTIAFDVCPANRVLNLLAADTGKKYDEDGNMAARGRLREDLFQMLNELDYYRLPYPKSLANDFGTDVLYPLLKSSSDTIEDALRTCTEHIAFQVNRAVRQLGPKPAGSNLKMIVTGGGAHNVFLIEKIRQSLSGSGVELVIPGPQIVDYKEALIMALLGILRWREENTILASVTGAARSSIGGAVWIGQEA